MISRIAVVLGVLGVVMLGEPYYHKYATYKAGRQYDNGDRVRVGTEVY